MNYDLCVECLARGVNVTATKKRFSAVFDWLLAAPKDEGEP